MKIIRWMAMRMDSNNDFEKALSYALYSLAAVNGALFVLGKILKAAIWLLQHVHVD